MKLFKRCVDGVHRFEARYDKGPADMSGWKSFSGSGSIVRQLAEKHRTVTYVCDICVRCGKIIERHTK